MHRTAPHSKERIVWSKASVVVSLRTFDLDKQKFRLSLGHWEVYAGRVRIYTEMEEIFSQKEILD
jgi:hypothetical protein